MWPADGETATPYARYGRTVLEQRREGVETDVSRVEVLATPRWYEAAACLHVDPDVFYPPGGEAVSLQQVDAAKVVCLRCPVRLECRAAAMAKDPCPGIWGGLTERERAALTHRSRS